MFRLQLSSVPISSQTFPSQSVRNCLRNRQQVCSPISNHQTCQFCEESHCTMPVANRLREARRFIISNLCGISVKIERLGGSEEASEAGQPPPA